jgi:S-DNA-T family DNA segregation ATPase FtsK/SpoIIIE
MNNEQNTPSSTSKIISKPRIISGITFIVLSVVLIFSFVSYLMNWKSDQSQAGTMADKTVQSSNIFGKIGDWPGIFIFESIALPLLWWHLCFLFSEH